MNQNVIKTIREMYQEQKSNYEFWAGEYSKHHGHDDLITAAQSYGQMCGLARAANELGYPDLWDAIHDIDAALYPNEFPF